MHRVFINYDQDKDVMYKVSSIHPVSSNFIVLRTEIQYSELEPIFLCVCVYNRKNNIIPPPGKYVAVAPYPTDTKYGVYVWESTIKEMETIGIVSGASNGVEEGRYYVMVKVGIPTLTDQGILTDHVVKSASEEPGICILC